MKRSAEQPSCSRAKRLSREQVLASILDDSEDDELGFDADYCENDIEEESDDMLEPSIDEHELGEELDLDQVTDHGNQPGNQDRPRPRSSRQTKTFSKFDSGWTDSYGEGNTVDSSFLCDLQPGPQNMPESITKDSKPIDFLNLFLDEGFWNNLCTMTNRRASQVAQAKPNSYYCKNYRDVTTREMKAFLGLRLQMECNIVKPRYEDYWQSQGKNFLAETPGFRSVMERDRFLGLWTFLHLVDEEDESVDKQDKIYKVRPLLNMLLPKFRHYYAPAQHLSLDEGMIPTKNRLGIKQYIKIKPIKWGIKAYMLCESNSGYIINADIYTGRTTSEIIPEVGLVGTVVVNLLTSAGAEGKQHILVMDRFYNSVGLFDYLFQIHQTFAVGTVLTNRKHFPKSLTTNKKMPRGEAKYLCHGNIVAMVWMDRRPIYFLSSYHNPAITGTVDRRKKDGSLENISYPELVGHYNKFMGGCDVNDQLCKLNKTRRHYRWPRRLFIKFVMWACYNAYIIMDHYAPHKQRGKRCRTFNMFINELCLSLVDSYRTAARRVENRQQEVPQRLQNVGLHFPQISPEATGNQLCAVCSYKYNKNLKDYPDMPYKDRPVKATKTKFWCGYCRRFLCIKEGSTCWQDWHSKQEYWR